MGLQLSSTSPAANIYMYDSRLLRAISRSDMKTFRHLLEKKVDMDRVEQGHTALNLAMHRRNDEAIEALLEAGCNPGVCGEDHFIPPLLQAVMWAFEEYVHLLVKYGCDVNIQNINTKSSAIHVAALHFVEHPKTILSIVDFLVDHGLDINIKDEHKETALHICAKHEGLGELLKYLLQGGKCDLNAQNDQGKTAIHKAIMHNNRVSLLYLVGAACDLNLRDCDGYSPLGLALFYGYEHLVEILLEHKNVDVNLANNTGTTPLHEIVLQRYNIGNPVKYIKLLNAHKCSVSQQDNNHNSALHLSARQGDELICQQLLQFGASHSLVNKEGKSPLYLASSSGCENIIHLLLDYGASLNLPDRVNKSPLYAAVYMGQEEVVKVLLQYGANVNLADSHGRTPLFVASKHGRHNIAQLLVKAGANPNFHDEEGKGPLHMAILFPKLDFPMIKLLLSAGCDPVNLDSFLMWVLRHLKINTDDLNAELGEWLHHMQKNAKPLRHICRVVIRKWIRTHVTPSRENLKEAVSKMPLPPALQYYLCAQDL